MSMTKADIRHALDNARIRIAALTVARDMLANECAELARDNARLKTDLKAARKAARSA